MVTLTARGPAEVIVPHLPVGVHRTRDIVFSPDGTTICVSVGSGSNAGEGIVGRFVAAKIVRYAVKGCAGGI